MNFKSLKFIAFFTFSTNILLGVINWLTNFIVLQKFEINIYSNFYNYIAILSILFIPATSINLIVNKYGLNNLLIFFYKTSANKKFQLLYSSISFLNLVFCFILMNYNILLSLLVFATTLIYYLSSIGKSYMVFLHRFNFCNISSFVEVFFKLIILIILIYSIGTIEQVPYISLYTQIILSALISLYFIFSYRNKSEETISELKIVDLVPSLLLSMVIILFINTDGIFINQVSDLNDRKTYLNLIQYAKIIYFVGLGFQPLITTIIEKYKSENEKISIINKFSLLILALNILFLITINIISNYIQSFQIIKTNFLNFILLTFALTLFCINLYKLVYKVHLKKLTFLGLFLFFQSFFLIFGFYYFKNSNGFILTLLITSITMFVYLTTNGVLDRFRFDPFKIIQRYNTYRSNY